MSKIKTLDDAPNPLSDSAQALSFVQSYWQIKPGVIRQAVPPDAARATITARTLRALAGRDDVESRLVQHSRGASSRRLTWSVTDGPFAANELPRSREPDWTVLVQGVDALHEPARALIDQFRFIPDSRLDDLMISLAGDGGGVGAHIDSYDVFLLQLAGERRWSIGFPDPGDRALLENMPHRLLKRFKPTQSAVLSAGDMLYLPAGWAHDGIARGPCMTASIGFRSPHATQLQAAWLSDAAWQLEQADPPTSLTPRRDLVADRVRANAQIRRWRRHPAQIDPDYMNHLSQTLYAWQARPRQMRDFVGRYLSEPKPSIWFERPADRPASEKLASMRRHGVQLDRKTRMLWFGEALFINGTSYRTDVPARTLLRRLADLRELSVAEIKTVLAAKSSRQLLFDWLDAGWVHAKPSED